MTLTETLNPKAPPIRIDKNGTLRVGDTRVTLQSLLSYYRQGMSAEELASAFDTLELADIHAVIAHYLANRATVDAWLADREREDDEIRKRIDARQSLGLAKQVLLDRQRQQMGRAE